jgi:acyl-CoA dehydrogenase
MTFPHAPARPSVASHALGIARAAFEDTTQYINERVQSGRRILENRGTSSYRPHGDRPRAVRALALARREAHRGGETGIGQDSSMLKRLASDLAVHIETGAVQLLGGNG